MAGQPPATYLGAPVPADIADRWQKWEAARWRQGVWRAANRPYPPDERFNIRPPAELCPEHRRLWIAYRNMRFDEETGNRWPGYDGSPFQYQGTDMDALRNERRVEWDEKASEQMQLIERICLSGRSPQCTPSAVQPVQLALDLDTAA
ncbi:hypothetical protein [Streptomyces liliifuscus]|uniref:Uncharacterized protein n=1 Tax=Streptomyces liliifuscus TaxID=2797636 RepID=A0A7T7RFU1_9ACTN|nr:hypothetical protein [Streptomyces liliifuscus]QQM45132.1 hypothetical protein JEQ17_40870 [Streptomyces liliifuscus]